MLLLLIFAPLLAPIALAESAEEILTSCRPIADAKVQGTTADFEQNFETGQCWGAFGVLQKVSRFVNDKNQPILRIGCAPATSTRTQFVAIFLEFARKNPQLLNEDFTSVAMAALRDAFPCGAQRTPAQ